MFLILTKHRRKSIIAALQTTVERSYEAAHEIENDPDRTLLDLRDRDELIAQAEEMTAILRKLR